MNKLYLGCIVVLIFIVVQGLGFAMEIPIYPGAKETEASKNLSSIQAQAGAEMQSFQTMDTFEEVVAFYEENLPSVQPSKMSMGKMKVATFMIMQNSCPKQGVSVQYNKEEGSTIVTIMEYKTD
ncbi:MAG TPA: hypothetical protein VKN82_04535 [Desulfohalobiaceae bacterium]|nr:hypothetical protein [Desulfohalobiaceae bacterium]